MVSYELQHQDELAVARPLSRDEIVAAEMLSCICKPVLYWLSLTEIEEVAINQPEEIWLRLNKPDAHGRIWIRQEDRTLTRRILETMIHALANNIDTPDFGGHGNPVCYGVMPLGHRFVAAVGQNVQYDFANPNPKGTVLFCSRRSQPERQVSWGDYGIGAGRELKPLNSMLARKADEANPLTRILNSIERGDHILISGSTGTGKTTLINSIIKMLNPGLRIVTIEDTPELFVAQRNHMHIMMNRADQSNNFTWPKVVDLIVRMTPDVVLAGEISKTNAATIWELMRSGHGHFMTTIHAENADEAVDTFITRIDGISKIHDPDAMRRQMRDKLRIIQINRDENNRRTITQVV